MNYLEYRAFHPKTTSELMEWLGSKNYNSSNHLVDYIEAFFETECELLDPIFDWETPKHVITIRNPDYISILEEYGSDLEYNEFGIRLYLIFDIQISNVMHMIEFIKENQKL